MHAVHALHPVTRRARTLPALLVAACLSACVQAPVQPPPPAPVAAPAPVPPTTTRGEFTLPASKLDVWNAIGQIVANTNGVLYQGRSQMLDLYTVRYHDQPFLLITHALLLSDTVKDTTTLVTARTLDGKPIDSDASAELLAMLQQQLPAQIDQDRVRQAAEAAAAKDAAKKAKAGKAKSKHHKKKP